MPPLWQGAEQHSLTSTSQKSPMKPGGQLRKEIMLRNCEVVTQNCYFALAAVSYVHKLVFISSKNTNFFVRLLFQKRLFTIHRLNGWKYKKKNITLVPPENQSLLKLMGWRGVDHTAAQSFQREQEKSNKFFICLLSSFSLAAQLITKDKKETKTFAGISDFRSTGSRTTQTQHFQTEGITTTTTTQASIIVLLFPLSIFTFLLRCWFHTFALQVRY